MYDHEFERGHIKPCTMYHDNLRRIWI